MRDAGLQGRLADFTLEEILQLIALQQKTGLLTVEASYPMFLAFDSGMLVAFRDRRRAGVDPLEDFLKRYGFFEVTAWESVEFVQGNSRLDLTEILVNETMLTAEELEKVQFDSAQEDIFRGMQLRDGRYHFTPGPEALSGLKGRVRFKVDGLLMEAVRRIDEIPGLRETFFSNDLTLRRSDLEIDITERSPTEQKLLRLLGKENALGVLVANGRMSEFDTLSYLRQLVTDDIVELQSRARPQPKAAAKASRLAGRQTRYSRRPHLVSALAIAATAAALFFQPFSIYRDAADSESAGYQYRQDRDRASLVAAIELYSLQHERPPVSLEDLRHDGWVDRSTLNRGLKQFEYVLDGSRWTLDERTRS
ncbi:hypothetical protein DRQ53_00070 [bacterium]|nr:MAG: hypothetical protein DRQ32_05055 [bacterium]RKZ18468.1 MAG: hypothetical protein DRQ53_00070 [bacterium]